MKTFAIVLALAAVAVAKPDFEACPGFEDNSFVNPWSFTINPDPVMAKEGAEVKIHFDATILKTLPVGTKIDVKMTKSGLPLPCLPVSIYNFLTILYPQTKPSIYMSKKFLILI